MVFCCLFVTLVIVSWSNTLNRHQVNTFQNCLASRERDHLTTCLLGKKFMDAVKMKRKGSFIFLVKIGLKGSDY